MVRLGECLEVEVLDEMAFKRLDTGESERRTTAQARAGRHIQKELGRDFDVGHHPKGGLVIRHKNTRDPEFEHGKASAKLTGMGVPHRHDVSRMPGMRNRSQLYVVSSDAHDYGERLKAEKA